MRRQRRTNRQSRFGISCPGQFTFALAFALAVTFALAFTDTLAYGIAVAYALAVTYAPAELCDVEKRWRAHGPQLE